MRRYIIPAFRLSRLHSLRYSFFRFVRLCIFLFTVDFARAEKPLVFAGDQDYAPLVFLEKGIPKGIYVDIIRAMDFGARPVQIQLIDWQKAQTAILAGHADVSIGMSISKERLQLFDFSDAVMTYEFAIFVRRGNIAIRDFADLRGHQVGVTAGGLPRKILEADAAIHLRMIPGYLAGFELLKQGKIDALVADKWVASYNIHQYDLEDIVPARGDAIIERKGAFSVRKGNESLLSLLNQKLRLLKSSGKLDEILERWSSHEMVYLTRARARNLMLVFILSGFGLILLLLVMWVYSLKRHLKRVQIAEEKKREREQFFEKLTRQVPGLIFEARIDETGEGLTFMYVNHAVENISELTREEALSESARLCNQIVPEDRKRFINDLQRSALELDIMRTEYRTLLPVQGLRWKRIEASPDRLEDGSIVWYGYISDVTDYKNIESALRESEERARAVAEHAPIGIVIADKNGRNIYTNLWLCERLGVNTADMLGDKWINFIHPQEKTQVIKAWAAMWMDGWPFEIEHRMVSAAQQEILFSACARKFHMNQDLAGAVILLRDITEQRAYETQIADLSRKIIDLREKESSEISRELHDSIGQNLVLLKLRLQQMRKKPESISEKSFDEYTETITQTLSMTREISRRLNPMHLQSVGLAAAVDDICDQVRQMSQFSIELDLEGIDGYLPEEKFIQAYRIIQEAVTNILKHSLGDKIRIFYEVFPHSLVLTIADNGMLATPSSPPAPGIGLQIMRERARLLGGKLNIVRQPTGFQVQVEIDL